MKTKALVMLSLVTLTLIVLSSGNRRWATAQSRQDGSEKLAAEVAQVQERVRRLEGRVDELSRLSDRLKTLESRVDELYRWTLHPAKK